MCRNIRYSAEICISFLTFDKKLRMPGMFSIQKHTNVLGIGGSKYYSVIYADRYSSHSWTNAVNENLPLLCPDSGSVSNIKPSVCMERVLSDRRTKQSIHILQSLVEYMYKQFTSFLRSPDLTISIAKRKCLLIVANT